MGETGPSLAEVKASVLKDHPDRDMLIETAERIAKEHERPEAARAAIEAELKQLEADGELRKIARELDRYLEKKSTYRVERIRAKRETRQPAEEVGEDTRELLDTKTRELQQLQTQLDYTFSRIIGYLPTEAREVSPNGKESRRKVTWQDIEQYLATGELENWFLEEIERQNPDIDPDIAETRAKGLVLHTRDSVAAADIIRTERGEEIPLAEQTDEQKMLAFFRWFRLRELAETRVVRGHLLSQIDRKSTKLRKAYADGQVDYRALDQLDHEIHVHQEWLRDEILSSPEAYYDYWGQRLLEAQRVFNEGGTIYETPSVKAKIAKVRSMLDQGQPVFIHGETGTGKTELAKYIAKHKYGKVAYLVSGRRGMELSEMTEMRDIQMRIRELPEHERAEIQTRVRAAVTSPEFEERCTEWAAFRGVPVETVKEEEQLRLEAAYVEYFKEPVKITSRLQPIFEAARDGRIVIIDEMNAIPHHTLIALNDLLTKRPVDTETYRRFQAGEVTIDEIDSRHKFRPIYSDQEIVIAPGFGIIATGNWKPEDGQAYVGRQQLDTAFLRRFGIVDYDYLANPIEGALEDAADTPEEERAKKQSAELFRMLAAQLLRDEGGQLTAEVPAHAFDELENLARVARIIQDGFSEAELPDAYQPESTSGTGAKIKAKDVIKENVADLGKLLQFVIRPWKAEGYQKPLEVYLFDRYLSRSSKARPTEIQYLYKLFQLHGFFKSEQGWPSLLDLGTPTPVAPDATEEEKKKAKKKTAAEMEQLAASRGREVQALVSKLETQIYGSPEEVGERGTDAIRWEKPPMVFYDATMLVDRLVGRGPERTRYPDLARAIAREGQTTETFEFSPEVAAERQDLRTWAEEVEAVVLEIIEKDQTDAFLAMGRELDEAIVRRGHSLPPSVTDIRDQLGKYPERARELLRLVQVMASGLDEQQSTEDIHDQRQAIIDFVKSWSGQRT